MKTHAVIGLAILSTLLSCQCLGQSTFIFNNFVPGVDAEHSVDAPVYDAFGVPLGPEYLAELWGGPSADSLSPAAHSLDWDQRLVKPFLSQGYLTASHSVVVFSPPGFPTALQLRAWDASLGATYEEVMARDLGGYGESPIFYWVGGNPTLVPPTAASPLIGLESFSLRAVIPEPSTWALFVLGGLAALGFQRQRGSHLALTH
jgi:hypothetical protein